ncbi:hypothetical protein C8Q80DRAFT_1269119 [Daedaleopsis nitida]|nr:hypothetical protein C8Q80DRAFT_1269119 [Daedaleopsis nitida]
MPPAKLPSQPDFSGPVNPNKHKRGELFHLAAALGVRTTSKDSKVTLAGAIQKHLDTHPELASTPAFQGLYAYRTDSSLGKKGRKKTTKTKDAQEDVTVTGSAVTGNGDDSSTYASSPPATPGTEGPGDHSAVQEDSDAETPRTPVKHVGGGGNSTISGEKATVIVSFLNPDNLKAPAEEICVEEGRRLKVERTTGANGNEHAYVRLSELMPVAIQQAGTPMKGRRARVSRAGIQSEGGRIDLGTIEAISEGKRVKQLELSKVDRLELQPVIGDDNTFICQLFLRDAALVNDTPAHHPTAGLQPGAIQPVTSLLSTAAPRNAPLVSTGRSTSTSKDGLVVFLRALFNGPQQPWRKAKTAGDILERQKMLERAMETLDELRWGKSKGGYRIPEDYADAGTFAGHSFVKQDVLRALHLGHSQASDDGALFKKDVLGKVAKVRDWYDHGDDSEHAARFTDMSIKEFRMYTDRKMKGKAHLQAKRKAELSPYNSDGDGQKAGPSKRGKKVKRARSSDHLDSESD